MTMRRILAGLVTGAALVVVGCEMFRTHRDSTAVAPAAVAPQGVPDAPRLVEYLNTNARRVQGLKAAVIMDVRADKQSASLDGYVACARPKNFRLKAQMLGQPAVDIGSNESEFWYWISRDNPPYVYHCSYADLERGVTVPFPFQPKMVLAALGLAEFDPNRQYKVNPSATRIELIDDITTPQGQPAQMVTVFNRLEARPGQPQVLGHVLRDAQGHVLCQATVSRVTVNRETGAVLPQQVVLAWPALKMQMQLQLRDVQVTNFAPNDALFLRSSLSNLTSFDLARRAVDNAGVQRTGGMR
jgi:hypothetical protein